MARKLFSHPRPVHSFNSTICNAKTVQIPKVSNKLLTLLCTLPWEIKKERGEITDFLLLFNWKLFLCFCCFFCGFGADGTFLWIMKWSKTFKCVLLFVTNRLWKKQYYWPRLRSARPKSCFSVCKTFCSRCLRPNYLSASGNHGICVVLLEWFK